jgi:acetate kinase
MNILVINSGSSSYKCWLGRVEEQQLPGPPVAPDWQLHADWSVNPKQAEVRVTNGDRTEQKSIGINSPSDVLEPLLRPIAGRVDVGGHRIVHGGIRYRESTLVTADVRREIAEQNELAPEHNRLELEGIDTASRVFGDRVPQVSVFDTAFHATLPSAAYVYPGPYRWFENGVRRFGFHGISHRYASRRAAEIAAIDLKGTRVVTCHLGNGCSLCAIRDGISVETTMGFTPLEGLMMGTRSGSIDPAILVYMMRHRGATADQLDRELNRESGLCGVSGLSGDMREILHAMENGHERARLAFEIYVHRLCMGIGSMVAVLGGLDVLVFTGGVGEHGSLLRQRVASQLEFLGLRLDTSSNNRQQSDSVVSCRDSKVRVVIVKAEENWEIARECFRLHSAKT